MSENEDKKILQKLMTSIMYGFCVEFRTPYHGSWINKFKKPTKPYDIELWLEERMPEVIAKAFAEGVIQALKK